MFSHFIVISIVSVILLEYNETQQYKPEQCEPDIQR